MATENESNKSSIIVRGKKNEFPGMVQISEAQAIEMQLTALKKFKPQSQMWPLTYGSTALGGISFSSLMVTGELFRKACLLPISSIFAVSLPVSVISAVTVFLLQHEIVQSDTLLLKTTCLPCVETRSAAIQGISGSIYPTALLIGGSLLMAQKYDTIYVPPPYKNFKKFLQKVQELARTRTSLISGCIILNLAAAFAITHLQQEAALRLFQQ